jgi:hypothetical protein
MYEYERNQNLIKRNKSNPNIANLKLDDGDSTFWRPVKKIPVPGEFLVTKLAVSHSFGIQSNIFSELRQEAPVGQSTKNLPT